MNSFLITGPDKKSRIAKFEEISGKKLKTWEKSMDFTSLEIPEDKKSIGIEQIRELQKSIDLMPVQGKDKIIFIDEADKLTAEAQNALLKTLEEPPSFCQIYLLCTNESILLQTIISRCQLVKVNIPKKIDEEKNKETSDIFAELLKISNGQKILLAEKEGITKDKESAIKWIDKTVLILREQLLNNPNDLNVNKYIKDLLVSKSKLESNCNVKLVIENLLLSLV